MKKIISILLIGILAILFGCTKDNPSDNGGGNSPTNNSAPSCSITSPQNGASFSLNDNISVSVSAADSDGTIAEVKLSIDNMEYQTATNSPYIFTITSGIVSSGVHTLKAVAKDNSGASAESSIVIIIEGNPSGNNVTPTCIITSPQNGTTFTYDENVNVTVFAEDSDGTIAEVSLYIDNIGYQNMTAFPYNFTIVSGVMSPGTHTIKAIAKDNEGSNGESSVTITIEEPATESPDFVSFSDGRIPPTWQTATWFVDNTGGYDDIYSLRVDYQGSVMTTKTIQGNGHLEFYAKSNDGYYFNDIYTPSFKLYIDGSTQFYYTEETVGSWNKYIVDLDEGTHTFLWEYIGNYTTAYLTIDAIKFVNNSNILRIGDYYQGGYIGHLDTREHGLIISISDIGTANALNASNLCYAYSNDGYYDWKEPTMRELENIAKDLYLSNIIDLLYGNYWTCNIYGSTTFYYVIVDCSQTNGIAGSGYTSQDVIKQVRAVRSF